MARIGYQDEGIAAYVWSQSKYPPGAVPLYRMYSPSAADHFYTTDAGERDNAARTIEKDADREKVIAKLMLASQSICPPAHLK